MQSFLNAEAAGMYGYHCAFSRAVHRGVCF